MMLRSARLLACARPALVLTAVVGLAVALAPGVPTAQQSTRREFTVSARRYAFTPALLEVAQGDLVRVTLRAEDIPHSFTIDEYRIAKRAGAGQEIVFEFHADRPGTFPFYCNLSNDEGCREMRGQLSVRPR